MIEKPFKWSTLAKLQGWTTRQLLNVSTDCSATGSFDHQQFFVFVDGIRRKIHGGKTCRRELEGPDAAGGLGVSPGDENSRVDCAFLANTDSARHVSFAV